MMTPEMLQKRVAAAEPGHIIEYHRGSVGFERIRDRTVGAIADAAAQLAAQGRVLLTQRKLRPGVYAYEATVAADTRRSYWWKRAA
jgi:hypothetical protein